MDIKIGDYWLTKNEKIVKIIYYHDFSKWPWRGDNGMTYSVQGRYDPFDNSSPEDLWRKISPEKYPEYFL